MTLVQEHHTNLQEQIQAPQPRVEGDPEEGHTSKVSIAACTAIQEPHSVPDLEEMSSSGLTSRHLLHDAFQPMEQMNPGYQETHASSLVTPAGAVSHFVSSADHRASPPACLMDMGAPQTRDAHPPIFSPTSLRSERRKDDCCKLECTTRVHSSRGYKGNANILVPGNIALDGDDRPRIKDSNIQSALFALRTKKQLTTKFSTYFLMFGREARIGRQPRTGGRGKLLNDQQEQDICNMVMANNAITLRQIRTAIIEDNAIFQNVNSISISTIDRILNKHQMTMKQLYTVPFERNYDRVKELRYQYVHVSQLLVVYLYNLFQAQNIRLKIRGPCSMQWTLRVMILQEIRAGDGCNMPAVFIPCCIARENIRCDVDENLWPDRQQRVDGQEGEEDGEDSDQ
ncbi:hypothetical protein F2P81_007569 [Scophthalmus maximus]|uniref:Uncharacterized protein n=1 Tax=Scophthalmus maximus TaxID=52904 RepID=A0A6A4T807_SCOMX|nr:hypothetical protein F2P81_007569 [Scophthalmus maximus]